MHAIVLVVQDPQADAAGAGLRPGDAALHPRGAHRRRRPRRDQGAAGRVGPPRHPGAAQGARQPVPRDHPAGRRLRQVDPLAATRATSSSSTSREYVVGHWWEQLLHNQSALRLKGRLLFTPGVMVSSVPWQLASSRGRRGPAGRPGRRRRAPRRGLMPEPTGRRPRGRRRGRGRRRPRSPTAATASRGTRARSCSSGTRCPASGCWPGSPRPAPASGSCRADAVAVLDAPRPTGSRRRARAPGPGCAAAATCSTSRCRASGRSRPTWCASRWRGWRTSTSTSTSSRFPATPTGSTGAPASSSRWMPRAGPGCAGTVRTTSSPSTTAASRHPASTCCGSPRGGGPAVERVDAVRPVGRGAARRGRAAARCVPVVHEQVDASWQAHDGSEQTLARELAVSARGFWQVHPGAARTLRRGRPGCRPARPGERALDLYAGVGLFASALAAAVGPDGPGRRRRVRPRAPPSTPGTTSPTSPTRPC